MSFACPVPFKGNVIKIVFEFGRTSNCSLFAESGLNLKGMVSSWPVVEVAEYDIPSSLRAGMRKMEVQPGPRITNSTVLPADCAIDCFSTFDTIRAGTGSLRVVDDDEAEFLPGAASRSPPRDRELRLDQRPQSIEVKVRGHLICWR